jgi:hypothetical protein
VRREPRDQRAVSWSVPAPSVITRTRWSRIVSRGVIDPPASYRIAACATRSSTARAARLVSAVHCVHRSTTVEARRWTSTHPSPRPRRWRDSTNSTTSAWAPVRARSDLGIRREQPATRPSAVSDQELTLDELVAQDLQRREPVDQGMDRGIASIGGAVLVVEGRSSGGQDARRPPAADPKRYLALTAPAPGQDLQGRPTRPQPSYRLTR